MLRDILYSTFAQAMLAPRKEERALLPGHKARPADILLPGWMGGKDTAMDITVVNPLDGLHHPVHNDYIGSLASGPFKILAKAVATTVTLSCL